MIKDKLIVCKTDDMLQVNTPSERLLDMDPEFYADRERSMSFSTNNSMD